MNYNYFVASASVLAIRTNAKDFKWSYGIVNQPATEKEYKSCKLRLTVIVEDINLEVLPDLGKFHYFSGQHGEDTLYYSRNFLFGTKLKIKFENLSTDEPVIRVNKTYFKYIKHRFMNLHSIHYILTDIASLLLLNNGFAPIHCSAFKKGDSVAVIFAPPNSGKTLSAMMACMELDAEFIAEDLAITDGKNIFSVPGTSTFRYYDRVSQSAFEKLKNKLTSVIPLFELISFTKPKDIREYTKSICHKAQITHSFILERGKEHIHEEEVNEAHRRIVNLNRYEFNYLKSPCLVAYNFYNKELGIDKALSTEKELLLAVLNNSQKIFSLTTRNPLTYSKTIMDLL